MWTFSQTTRRLVSFTIPKNGKTEPFSYEVRRCGQNPRRPECTRHNRGVTRTDRGSASLEFVVVALAVLIPVLALTVSTSAIQRAQFAATEIARQGVRAVALAPSDAAGARALRRIARLTLSDFGIDAVPKLVIVCSRTPCRVQGSLIRVTTTIPTPLAMVPALPGLKTLSTIPISAVATHRAPLPVIP